MTTYAPQSVFIHLTRLVWEAAGLGAYYPPNLNAASPYLWTIYFVIDGTTVRLLASGHLSGTATMYFMPGNQGDLGEHTVSPGQGVAIPGTLGWWSTTVQPIPVDPTLQTTVGTNLPAFFGAVVVAVSEGDVTNSARAAGHNALNAYVESAINRVIASIGPLHQQPTQQDINSITAGASQAVTEAVKHAQSFFQNIASWFAGDRGI